MTLTLMLFLGWMMTLFVFGLWPMRPWKARGETPWQNFWRAVKDCWR